MFLRFLGLEVEIVNALHGTVSVVSRFHDPLMGSWLHDRICWCRVVSDSAVNFAGHRKPVTVVV